MRECLNDKRAIPESALSDVLQTATSFPTPLKFKPRLAIGQIHRQINNDTTKPVDRKANPVYRCFN